MTRRPALASFGFASWLLLGISVPSVMAQLLGPEFQVNSYTTFPQLLPAVAADGAGNFVVVWSSYGQDGSSWGVFGQRFSSAGLPLDGEFQVNSYTTGYQLWPAVAADGAGNFVVVWAGDGQDGSGYGVFGQRFSSAGFPLGSEFQVNTYTTGYQRLPAVAADDAGNFVVVWDSDGQYSSPSGVFGQRFSSVGLPLGSEFRVNTYPTYVPINPAVAADATGNFVVVWDSPGQDGSGAGVFGRRCSSTGLPLGSEFQVNTYTTMDQGWPALAADGAGNFIVVWQSSRQDGWNYGVFGQRFSSAGTPMGSEFQVNSFTMSDQWGPAVAAGGAGNFVVVWSSYGQDGSSWGVFGQRGAFALFADGFEAGDVCAWSVAVGGGACPQEAIPDAVRGAGVDS